MGICATTTQARRQAHPGCCGWAATCCAEAAAAKPARPQTPRNRNGACSTPELESAVGVLTPIADCESGFRRIQCVINGGSFLFIVEFFGPLPSCDRGLLGARQRELTVRCVLRDGRSCADGGAGTDAYRRHHHGAGTDEGAIVDHRRPFVLAVIVASDAAGTDMNAAAHPGIAHIAQMIGFAAHTDFTVLRFDEIADVYVAVQNRVGADSRERADTAVLGHACIVDDAVGEDFRAGSDL